MRRVWPTLLALVVCLSALPWAGAAEGRDLSRETALAGQLQALGLFRGVGEGEDGSADFALDRSLSRVEGVTLLVRALGKGAEAEGYPKTHPFTDVPTWADGYVSWAYDQGLTKGTSEATFGSADTATGEMYLTFLLRALGYSEGPGWTEGNAWQRGDFSWESPWALAAQCGILPMEAEWRDILRADAVSLTAAALYAPCKDGQTTLAQRLIAQGAFTQADFDAAFPADPFERERALARSIGTYLEEQGYVGPQENPNSYGYVCFILDRAVEWPEGLAVDALVGTADVRIQADNTLGSRGIGTTVWRFLLDPEDLTVTEGGPLWELTEEGTVWEDTASPRLYTDDWSWLTEGMEQLYTAQALEQMESGAVAYRQPTYEEAMAQQTQGRNVTDRLESAYGTVLRITYGTPHGLGQNLYLVTKAPFCQGEGHVVSLPLCQESTFQTATPEQLALSPDGRTLTYAFHIKEDVVDMSGANIIQEKGDYLFTVDLFTGEAAMALLEEGQSAYETAMAGLEAGSEGFQVRKQMESSYGTVVLYTAGASHGENCGLVLVAKAGSHLGEGTVIDLPLPNDDPELGSSCGLPQDISLSADGERLVYTFRFGEPASSADGTGAMPEAGTYRYTTDLTTGETEQTIIPDGALAEVRPWEQGDYEAALQVITDWGGASYPVTVAERLETDYCTILSYQVGGLPPGGGRNLTLVYKPGSGRGAGTRVELSLLRPEPYGGSADPSDLTVSTDGRTFTYLCRFDAVLDADGTVVQPAETYRHTVDLATGAATMERLPER